MRTLFCLALALGSTTPLAQTCQPLQEYDEILAVVTENFYDQTFRGLDWPRRVADYRNEIGCYDSEQAVAVVVNELLSELNTSHTAVFTTDDLDYWALQSIFASTSGDLSGYRIDFSGIWPEQRDGKWYAKYVLGASAAELAGIFPGDELTSLDGGTFNPLGFSADLEAILTVSSDGSSTRRVGIRATHESIMQSFVNASRASRSLLSVDDKRVGYFHLWTGNPLILESLNAALASFEGANVDALILDLRGGFGGMGPPYLRTLRDSAYLSEIPKFFLIDDGARSGKELVAGIVKRAGLGTLVGSTTAGYYLGGSPFRLFDEKYFVYVAVGGGSPIPGIGVIEGIGIEPDIAVLPCRTYCGGHDPQLGRALELIGELG